MNEDTSPTTAPEVPGLAKAIQPRDYIGQSWRPMPQYVCHKKVWALKISAIEFDSVRAEREGRETTGGAWLTVAEPGFAEFEISPDFLRKSLPQIGGYLVQYEDGYKSYSPAKAFEDGYALIK